MSQDLLPATMRNGGMAGAFQGLNPFDDNLADGIGQSYGVIKYRGKVWSLQHRGNTYNIIRPDDGTPSGHLDVIILGQAKSKSKSYYPDYKDGSSDRPTCSSIDGVVPDADIAEPQSPSCALCPKNTWKTMENGRKGRECTDYKRMAVLILPTQTAPVMGGVPLLEPVFLRVPPDSLNSLAVMGEQTAKQGYHFVSFITRITFDPAKAHPCMVFRPIQKLTDAEAQPILDLVKDPMVGRITGGDLAGLGLRAVAQALQPPGSSATGLGALVTPKAQTGQVNLAGGASAQQQAVQHPTVPPAGSSGVSGQQQQAGGAATGLKPAGAVQPATPDPRLSAIQSGITTGLGGATSAGGASTVSAEPAQPRPGVQTADDVGQAEASDEDLDAQIARLIKS